MLYIQDRHINWTSISTSYHFKAWSLKWFTELLMEWHSEQRLKAELWVSLHSMTNSVKVALKEQSLSFKLYRTFYSHMKTHYKLPSIRIRVCVSFTLNFPQCLKQWLCHIKSSIECKPNIQVCPNSNRQIQNEITHQITEFMKLSRYSFSLFYY